MTRRTGLLAAIALLVALNVWRWWPAAAPETSAPNAPRAAAPSAALQLAARVPEPTSPGITRNPFQMGKGSTSAPSTAGAPRPAGEPTRAASAVTRVSLPVEAAPPPKTPEEIEAEVVQFELGQVKLVGVIVRDGKPQAYFAHGDRTYLVSVGDAVGRFAVVAISAESAKLHDRATGQSRVIPVLGK